MKEENGLIELNKVSYDYITASMKVEAVKEVSFSFVPGKLYSIQGSSGSGKSTLLSLMAGLDIPTSGEVLVEGKATAKIDLDLHRRKNVAVIYQSLNLLPLLTVAENIMYPMEINGIKPKEARKRASEYISMVGITEEEFSRFPATLSGGQQQRVAIARALGSTARVILADEPTGSLDSENSKNVIQLLKKLAHERNCCVIVVTHDKMIAEYADIRLEMSDGRLGSP